MPNPTSNAAFVTPGPYLVLRDFLGREANEMMLNYVRDNRTLFQPSTLFRKGKSDVLDSTFRISSSMEPTGPIQDLFKNAIKQALNQINKSLGPPGFVPGSYEVEIAAHNDGAFFKRHIDTATGSNRNAGAARITSAVYYFFQKPAAFTGGELRLRSIAPEEQGGGHVDIPPENDMLLVFPSWSPHEVLPVSCPSGAFEDSRFAVNCWLVK